MNVAQWLRQLGLDRYEAVFRENDVSAEVLPSLTADDLKELGVASVGHRRRLLEAIAALSADPEPAGEQSLPSQTIGPSTNDGTYGSAAERRQVCVMFCDIAGFAALSSRLDPEDLSAVIRQYQSRVTETIVHFGGFVARYVGDGILIYFGWPEAHEANAERAVRGGLAVIDAIGRSLVRMGSIQVRIGIATGLVVVGEPIGDGEARQHTAIGETPNLAARLQGLANPNSVVIDAATRRQIGGLFDCRDLGLVALKGLPGPVPAWEVIEATEIESRFEAMHANTITPLIGREEELDLLLRRWRQAKDGEGQLVLLCGEPGIGKSRLIAALEERLLDEPHISMRYFCSPHHQDSAFYPIVTRWERDLKFARGDTPREKLQKLEATLTRRGTSLEDVARIADFLSLPTDADRYPPLDFNPQRRKEKNLDALIRLLTDRAHRRPVLMLFEDAHWADASTLGLLDWTIGQLTNLPVLFVVSFRPEFRPPWAGLAVASLITLKRLTQGQAAKLAAEIMVERTLSSRLLEQIVSQTDGVPLFIEELTKAVLEGAEQPDGQFARLKVPTTLQASLIARFDRLPAAKQVAQVGAAIGREFAHTLLAAVAKIPEAQLTHGIDTLVASGLAFQRGVPPDAVYTFKHALVRDAAYNTLLRGPRKELHASIGSAIEEQFPEIGDMQPEILAHHFVEAGLVDRAIEWSRRAGLRNVARSAHAEALVHFASALDLLAKGPPSEQRDLSELDLTLDFAVPLLAIHGYGALRVEQCALRATELSDKLLEAPGRFAARRLAWNSCLMRQPVAKTVAFARDLIWLADKDPDAAKQAVAHRALGYSLLVAGEFREAGDILDRGAAFADTISGGEFTVYGEHPSIVCRIYSAKARIVTGSPVAGARLVDEAVTYARRDGSAHSLAWALGVAAFIFQIHNEPATAARFASETIDVARRHHLAQWLSLGERCMGWAMCQLGDATAGLELQLQGVQNWNETGAMLHTTHCHVPLVEAYLQQGQTDEARVHLDIAHAHRAAYGEDYLAAEIERLEGLLRHHQRDGAAGGRRASGPVTGHSAPAGRPYVRTAHGDHVRACAG